MKVMLPVSPRYKTRGEVASLRWVREHTNIPVPQVLAFEDSNDNCIGFEWILMEFIAGIPAHRRWRKMSMEQKSAFTRRVAEFQMEQFRNRASGLPFTKIGTLDLQNGLGDAEASPRVSPGKLVSIQYFMRKRLKYEVPQGPFRNNHDWFNSVLGLTSLEQTDVLKTTEDEAEREDAEEILNTAQRLLSLLPTVFPEDHDDEVPTALHHDHLSLHDILVNEHGEITAIINWGCVSAVPVWLTTRVPSFLAGQPWEEEPDRDLYSNDTPEESAEKRGLGIGDPDYLDDEGNNELYWIHRMDYERTELRKVFKARLTELRPEFPLEESAKKVGFFEAVMECSHGVLWCFVNRWLDSLEKGHVMRWGEWGDV